MSRAHCDISPPLQAETPARPKAEHGEGLLRGSRFGGVWIGDLPRYRLRLWRGHHSSNERGVSYRGSWSRGSCWCPEDRGSGGSEQGVGGHSSACRESEGAGFCSGPSMVW
jgi:hypothetical protein